MVNISVNLHIANGTCITGIHIAELVWPAVPRKGESMAIVVKRGIGGSITPAERDNHDATGVTCEVFEVIDVVWSVNGNALVYVIWRYADNH